MFQWLTRFPSAAFTALPLILQAIKCQMYEHDFKGFADTHWEGGIKKAQLNVLLDAMQIFAVQYDEAEWISAITRQAIQHARCLRHDRVKDGGGECTRALSTSPTIYLQSAVAVDWTLSRGKYAFVVELPANLRDWFHEGSKSLESQSSFGTNKNSPDSTNVPEGKNGAHRHTQSTDSTISSAGYGTSDVEEELTGNPGSREADSYFDVMDLLKAPLGWDDVSHFLEPLGSAPASTLETTNMSVADFVLWDSEMDMIA